MTNNNENQIKYVVDTNVWLSNLSELLNYENLVVTGAVLRELDKLKGSSNNELAYRSRLATRHIKDNEDKFTFDLKDYNAEEILGQEYDNNYADNRIIAQSIEYGGVISNDLNVQFKAIGLGLDVVDLSEEKTSDELEYTGIKKLYFYNTDESQEDLAMFYQHPDPSRYGLLQNQYLVLYDAEKVLEYNKHGEPIRHEVIDKYRYDGEKLVKLKLPKFEGKEKFKTKNEEQELALDLLNNPDVPIKIIAGTYGSGKTFLAVKSAIHNVIEKGNQAKILVLRNPIGTGEAIGYLKGSKEDKTEDFFKPIYQQLSGGEQEAEILKTRGQLLADIPYFIKGQTFEDTFGIVDESEDLDIKQFKLVGSRIGENCVMAFVGDIKQAEDKYKSNNGLLHAINSLKGNPLVGIVVLSDDVRSEASKVFADM